MGAPRFLTKKMGAWVVTFSPLVSHGMFFARPGARYTVCSETPGGVATTTPGIDQSISQESVVVVAS